jgi:hypothetical protein
VAGAGGRSRWQEQEGKAFSNCRFSFAISRAVFHFSLEECSPMENYQNVQMKWQMKNDK